MAVLHPPHLRQPAKANLHLEMMGLSSSRWFLPEVSTSVTKTSYPAACACMRFAEAARRGAGGAEKSESSQSYALPIPAYRSGI
jgi:hypothetical protein